MESSELPTPHPSIDRPRLEAKAHELSTGDDAVLPTRKPFDRREARAVGCGSTT